jgi:hypothetical protein
MVSWQKIDKNNLRQLQRHYQRFEPYCHLNIIDMWSYRVGPNHWFRLGDTIVYRLNDYVDDSLYLTVLGKDSAKQAISELCKKYKGLSKITLRCVPESTLKALGKWNAVIGSSEDQDNHDYIFSVKSLVDFSSPQLQTKQRKYRRLVKRYPKLKVKLLDHYKASDRRLLYRAFKRWVTQTNAQDWQKEYLALKRALNLKGTKLVCLGFFDGQKIIGYTINEPERSSYYYQAFFGKSDRRYGWLGLLIEHETAEYFYRHYGSKYMNLQPDSGIVGLRRYKTSLGPIKKLKKYTVVIDSSKARA